MTSRREHGSTAPLTELTPQECSWRTHVREFAETKVRPRVHEMDAKMRLDADLIGELFGAGLMGIQIPEAYGGADGELFHSVLAIEELARVDPAVAVFVDVQNALLNNALLRHGSGDQKRRHLPRLATGTVGAFAISEQEAGSDAFALSTAATSGPDGFELNGRKQWTTNAAEAGLFLVFAASAEHHEGAPSITAFLVEKETAGLAVGESLSKLGIRASSTCQVVLDEVEVRHGDVLGGVGAGDVLAVEALAVGKIGIAAQLVGLAQGALDMALSYAKGRRQFGQAIADFQGVQFPLAALGAEVEAARLYLYNTARMSECGSPSAHLISAAAGAKYFASEVAEKAASQAVETLGGNGFVSRYPVEKFYRDAKIGKIYEGTSNMQLRTIAGMLLRAQGEGSLDTLGSTDEGQAQPVRRAYQGG